MGPPPDFETARQRLVDARAAEAEAREGSASARTALHRADAATTQARRARGARDPEHDTLAAALGAAQSRRVGAVRRARDLRGELDLAIDDFAPFSDPRQALARLGDAAPILLFPVRLETRFRRDLQPPKLLVRIYPDTCLIDTFEPTLAEVEASSARRYWEGIWASGGLEVGERGAWAGLVASHGSGRAGWIVDTMRPANEAERPSKVHPSDQILVVSLRAALPAAEATAVAAFWPAMWRADAVAADEQAARAALHAVVGPARGEQLEAQTLPVNFSDVPTPPLGKANVAVSTGLLVLPDPVSTKAQSWSQAPRVDLLPDRFVLILESGSERREIPGLPVRAPLIAGPDPFADPANQFTPVNGELAVPDELRWMSDFDRAVEVGMGFEVELTAEQAKRGFDRLSVLGVRVSTTEQQSAVDLERLVHHHANGRGGLRLLPQGTPTNNTEDAPSGYTRGDDPDVSFDDRLAGDSFVAAPDPRRKTDGQWLAELLGIAPDAVARVAGAGGLDQRDARAMQTALWPATLGYFLDAMMSPLVDDRDVEHTRWFFTRHVSGRGPAPALRIGAQPYGILPTTAFSRMTWLHTTDAERLGVSRARLGYLRHLDAMLRRVEVDWRAMSDAAPAVGRGTDAHKTLLGVLGLQPTAAEYHYRYAETLDSLFNQLSLVGLAVAVMHALILHDLDAEAMALLIELGADREARPALFERYFLGEHGALFGDLVDDRPLSERDPIRPSWTTDGRSWLRWLIDAGGGSLDELRRQTGFVGGRPPRALLYLLLRHALILGYADAARELHRTAGASERELQALREEPPFVHVDTQGPSESRWAPLYAHNAAISPAATRTVAAHIASVLEVAPETSRLQEQLEALELLADASTARLERAMSEHVDCCGYRYDAWRLGFVSLQLEVLRKGMAPGAARRGVYLGAYSWLEDLRPDDRVLTPVDDLPADLSAVFDPAADPRLMRDSTNGGHIQAPSLNHAVTAAVLRSGYLANAKRSEPDTLAVNLSSARVRHALEILDGIRNGQNLGALLGYRMERGLHEGHPGVELDRFIAPLRHAFPLVADQIESTAADPGHPHEAIAARNVLDGRRLVAHVRATGKASYPFGLSPPLPDDATTDERNAIDAEVTALLNVNDAVGDLALAEGVHQAVQGNYDRVSATLTSVSSGQLPPDPDVVRTPATGVILTHRVGLHLQPGLGEPANPTPRSAAEPAINAWLAERLPDLDEIACRVIWKDPVNGSRRELTVTMQDLGFQPLDLLEVLRPDDPRALGELEARVMSRTLAAASPRPDSLLTIEHRRSGSAAFSVFELAAPVGHLRSLLLGARPLRPGDVRLPQEATTSEQQAVFVEAGRLTTVETWAKALLTDAVAYLAALRPLLHDQPAQRPAVVAGIDDLLGDAVRLLNRAARFGVGQSTWGHLLVWRRDRYAGFVKRVRACRERLDDARAEFDRALLAYDSLPAVTPDADRFTALQRAEALLSTSVQPRPATPAALRAALPVLRAAHVAKREQLDDVAEGAAPTLAALHAAMTAALPLSAFDPEPFSLDELERAIVAFAGGLASAVEGVGAELKRRTDAATTALAASSTAADPTNRVAAVTDAARALLGDGFQLVPEFTVDATAGAEWQLALSAGDELLEHLHDNTAIGFPVDEWLAGAARVRGQMRHLEQANIMAGAFGAKEIELLPMQLPHIPGDSWLALDFPAGHEIDGERLLYTAGYSAPFSPGGRQCALLVDEWTEVVPGDVATTGLTFQYDQPNNEAPQTLLLVTPATWDGAWQWEDVTAALSDTLQLAKYRAVEPDQIDGTVYARFLPATTMAATPQGITIATALAINNGVADLLAAQEPDG